VQQEGIYKKLYDSQIAGQILKPKLDQIKLFFKSGPGPKIVDEDNTEFVILLSKVSEVFFQEINSCIYCMT
jgi:hypothetical protein